ncbi:MAG: ADP-ribosylglycohydrolase family protein [Microlunatus sp.]|nr:ADP-ribosylglycohydrolase family protein [Microlunatus sp.]
MIMHDPLSSYDLVQDELAQAGQTGHQVADLAERFAATDPQDVAALEALYAEVISRPRSADWPYAEPDDLAEILAALPDDPATPPPPADVLADKVLGGWLGRIAGCNLGKPVEDGDHWTSDRLRDYLTRAGAWPLRDYFPVLDPMPEGFAFRDNWIETTRGRVDGSARDDDIDYAILGLHLLERHGRTLRTDQVADAWLTLLPYQQVYTAERAGYRNLIMKTPVDQVAATRNPYREWIGALIRGDAFGWTHPGDPRSAISIAYRDAALSHVGNGIYGELWSSALVAAAFTTGSAREAYERSLRSVPPASRLYEALIGVRELSDQGRTWDEALRVIQQRWGHYGWVHTINNAALIAAGVLWGDGDYATTVGLTVQGGWDTDSNGATAGSVAGVLTGAANLPRRFVEPLHDRTRSALFGFDNSIISELAGRTLALIRS